MVLAGRRPGHPDDAGLGRPPPRGGTSGSPASLPAPSSGTARGGCTPRPTRRWPRSTSTTASPTRPSSPECSEFPRRLRRRGSPARETFARIARVAAEDDLRKSFFGKNMLHTHEHALIMYLHGRALEGLPARLFYAFPEDQALTAEAKPYWFDAAASPGGGRPALTTIPGRRLVEVEFQAAWTPSCPRRSPPPRTPAPRRLPRRSRRRPASTGWHHGDATVSLWRRDDEVVGVEGDPRPRRRNGRARVPRRPSSTRSGARPAGLTAEGDYDVTYFAVDPLGNHEPPQSLASGSTAPRRP